MPSPTIEGENPSETRRGYAATLMPGLRVTPGSLSGLFVLDLVVHEDPERPRASFREVFRAEDLEASGAPPFRPVQCSVSESARGTIRGIHAEPWDKLLHVVEGEVFSAIADVRPASPTAGQVWTGVLDRTNAVLVGAGLGNAFQVISERAVVAFLVNDYWRPGITYPAVRFDDADLAIDWPIADHRLVVSEKDRRAPTLRELWAG
jgi:dTDP-4-dehydrorhamnose 3,5-epimerase/reductase